ncbi:MAG: glycoside hydrolase family 38 N-terminal domain-containing protein [Gaiellaceae bacterium]
MLEVPEQRLILSHFAAAFGHLRVPFELADGAPEVEYRLSGLVEQRGTLRRRRKWRVHVTPHAHTDIGYTHRQWEVAERLARNIDAALATGAAYHLDSAWALETWLETREPADLSGIAVSGIYVDLLTQTAALEDLVRNGAAAKALLDRAGLATDFVSIVDVASLSGSLPAILEGSGLPYLVHASNQDRGPFRVNGGLHRLSPYWWEGTAGGRVLVWLAKMYCELRKVCGSPPVPDSAARGLDLWLAEYERDDYLPDSVLLYGQEADNTDLDPQPAEFVRRWNEEFEWPRLVPSDVSAFFREVEPLGERLPTVRGDGGAYWEDGVGSAATLTALARQAQADLPAAERLEALAVLHAPGRRYPAEQFDEAWRQLLLWDEHTWGAFLSAREPDALLQRDQWAVKEQFGRDAAGWATRLLHTAASRHALQWNTDGREVVVHNPHSWTVSGTAVAEIEAGESLDAPTRVLAAGGSQQTVELWVDALPGLSSRRFPLGPASDDSSQARGSETVLENEHYRLVLDPERGCLRSLVDRALGRELVDADAPWGFGQLVQALGGEGTRLVSNQADLPEAEIRLETGFELRELRSERFGHGASVTLAGADRELEWTLLDRARRVDLRVTWRKPERRRQEAAYVAFPAALPGAAVLSDSQLGWVEWGADDLPGACQEWLPLQTGILLRGEGCDLHLCSPDVPLFCVGDVVRGRWPVRKDQRGGRILSYVANNYWHTNYRASQGGELTFRYRLTSSAAIDPAAAYRAGWEARRGLYGQRISIQDFRAPAAPQQPLASVEPEHVVLTTLKGTANGFVARFQEIAGAPARARLAIPGRAVTEAWRTDLLERDLEPLPVEDGAVAVDVPAWRLATVRFVV